MAAGTIKIPAQKERTLSVEKSVVVIDFRRKTLQIDYVQVDSATGEIVGTLGPFGTDTAEEFDALAPGLMAEATERVILEQMRGKNPDRLGDVVVTPVP